MNLQNNSYVHGSRETIIAWLASINMVIGMYWFIAHLPS